MPKSASANAPAKLSAQHLSQGEIVHSFGKSAQITPDQRETIPPQDIFLPLLYLALPTTPPASPAQPDELLPSPTTPEPVTAPTTEET